MQVLGRTIIYRFSDKMTARRPEFVIGVDTKDMPYTPRQVIDYISSASSEGLADPVKVRDLIWESRARAEEIMSEYGLAMSQELQISTSEAGKALAELAAEHCTKHARLLRKGGGRMGIHI